MGGYIYGYVDLTDSNDTFNNDGEWYTGGTSFFGGGYDVLNNTGTSIVAAFDSDVSEDTVFDSLEVLNNSGLISLSDETTGNGATNMDTLTVDGDFIGTGASRLELDVFVDADPTGVADMLIVNGSTSGSTVIAVTNTNPADGGINTTGIILVDVNDAETASESDFTLEGGFVEAGAVDYRLFFDDATNNFILAGVDGNEVYEPVNFLAGGQSIWYITAQSWLQHELISDLADKPTGAWANILYEAGAFEVAQVAELGSLTTEVDNSYHQGTFAALIGYDWALNGLTTAPGTIEVGAMAGYISSTMSFDNTETTGTFTGYTLGARASYVSDVFRVEGLVKQDVLDLAIDMPTIDASADTTVRSLGAEVEAGYLVYDNGAYKIEAVGNVAHVRTTIDDFSIDTLDVSFGDGVSTRAAIGFNLSTEFQSASGMTYAPTFTAKLWNEFEDQNTATIATGLDTLEFDAGFTGMFVEVGAGLEFWNTSGFTGFASGNVQTNGDFFTIKGQLGVNYEF